MPSDIRSFFGGKPPVTTNPDLVSRDELQRTLAAKPPKQAAPKKARGSRKVVDDSDDDEDDIAPKCIPKPVRKQRDRSPDGEATSKDDFFGESKPKRSTPLRKSSVHANGQPATSKASPSKSKGITQPNRNIVSMEEASAGRTAKRQYAVPYAVSDDEMDGVETRRPGKPHDAPKPMAMRTPISSRAQPQQDSPAYGEVVDTQDVEADCDGMDIDRPKNPSNGAASGRKRKSIAISDDEADVPTSQKSKTAKKIAPRNSPAKKAKKDAVEDSAEIQAILDSIPLVSPPSPPTESKSKKSFPFGAHANSGPAPAEGSKEMPQGAENCLAGLTFVFTGLLDSLSRDSGQELVKRYGGKCTATPSSKTSYVVLGTDAGPKKLETIKKYGLKTINEDGLFELIRRLPANGGDSKAGAAYAEKQKKQLETIKKQAAEIDEAEKAAARAATTKAAARTAQGSHPVEMSVKPASTVDGRLWTVKYAPNDLKQICGNKAKVEVLQRWLRNFPQSQRRDFKMGGPDGTGLFRAVIISGPPGIGKTTAAHLVSSLEGYDVVESNASDARSKKLVEAGVKDVLDTTSLLGYFAGDGSKADKSKKKLVLIMDEVDGMSSGDRGGAGALSALCKKSSIPIILICNDRRLPKMKTFDHVAYNMPFIRPTTDMIRSRVMTIAFREGMKLPLQVVNALIEGTGADIRQVVNMLSTVKLDAQLNGKELTFDDSKEMSKAWEKFTVLKPWDTVHKILSSGMFSPASKTSLNDKISLYFNDHSLNPLMLQENYLSTSPILALNLHGKAQKLKTLELIDQAANSISDGDLVDRMIHSSQQWSLMPTHAVMSFVRPASFVAGSMAGHQSAFTAWMGKNSTQTRLTRLVKEIQGHMRLRCSADRHAIRQYYLPLLWTQLIRHLEKEGKDGVPKVIEIMDSYFLTKDDWDAILELGIGPMDQANVKLDTQTKATFTRLYNSQSHPLPFMKAGTVGAPRKPAEPKPDLEEAIDDSDEGDFVDETKGEDDDDDLDLSKPDKYIKAPKKKRSAGGGKGKIAAEDDGDAADNNVKSTSKKPKVKTSGKGKAKK